MTAILIAAAVGFLIMGIVGFMVAYDSNDVSTAFLAFVAAGIWGGFWGGVLYIGWHFLSIYW